MNTMLYPTLHTPQQSPPYSVQICSVSFLESEAPKAAEEMHIQSYQHMKIRSMQMRISCLNSLSNHIVPQRQIFLNFFKDI